jgi:hypothetical protein
MSGKWNYFWIYSWFAIAVVRATEVSTLLLDIAEPKYTHSALKTFKDWFF